MYSNYDHNKMNNNEIILESIGLNQSNGYIDTSSYLQGPCPCHNGDNPSGFCYYYNSGIWLCFTRGCHDDFPKGILGLVMAIKKVDKIEAQKIISDIAQDANYLYSKTEIMEKIKKIDYWEKHCSQIYVGDFFKAKSSPDEYCNKRGISMDVVKRLGAFICQDKGKMADRFVVPIKNINGTIVGYSGRAIKDFKPKWFHYPNSQFNLNGIKINGFSKSINLFNIDMAKNHTNKPIIITEGPFDAMKLIMSGFDNCISIFGNIMSNGQVDILKKCGFSEAILALDNDIAGTTGSEKTTRKLEKALFRINVLPHISDHKDIGECSTEEIVSAMKEMKCLK